MRVLTVKVGQEAQFGSLSIQVQACERPPARPAAGFSRLPDDHRQPCRCAGLPRLDAGEQPVAVDAAASDLRRARRRLPDLSGCRPSLPPERAALLLDLDGTLLDLAPAPDAVVVPAGLCRTRCARCGRLLGDAVAVVTGRPVETVDALLGDAVVRGGRRAWRRDPPRTRAVRWNGRPCRRRPRRGWSQAERLAPAHPGALLERKARGFALHYRAVPAAGPVAARSVGRAAGGLRRVRAAAGAHDLGGAPARRRQGQGGAPPDGTPAVSRPPAGVHRRRRDRRGWHRRRGRDGRRRAARAGAFGDAAGVRAWLRELATTRRWPT